MTQARQAPMTGKPTVAGLGIDVAAQHWQRSGDGTDALEIAFVSPAAGSDPAAGSIPAAGSDPAAEWVLMRVAGDPEGRVLVYDRNEWECFLDGVRGGEFDDAAG